MAFPYLYHHQVLNALEAAGHSIDMTDTDDLAVLWAERKGKSVAECVKAILACRVGMGQAS